MNRRTVLRGAALTAAGGGVAALALSSAPEGEAQASTTLDVAGDRATIGPDGSVAAVSLAVDVGWAYDLPDGRQPEVVRLELAAAEAGDELQVVVSTEQAELFPEASGEESLSGDLVESGVLDAAAIAPEDGERATDVDVEARLEVENGDGEVLARDTTTDSATVTVERDAIEASEYGDVGGAGGLSIETQ